MDIYPKGTHCSFQCWILGSRWRFFSHWEIFSTSLWEKLSFTLRVSGCSWYFISFECLWQELPEVNMGWNASLEYFQILLEMLINIASNERFCSQLLRMHCTPILPEFLYAVRATLSEKTCIIHAHVTQHCPSLFEHFTASGLPPKNASKTNHEKMSDFNRETSIIYLTSIF